jgi:hypothetical protein
MITDRTPAVGQVTLSRVTVTRSVVTGTGSATSTGATFFIYGGEGILFLSYVERDWWRRQWSRGESCLPACAGAVFASNVIFNADNCTFVNNAAIYNATGPIPNLQVYGGAVSTALCNTVISSSRFVGNRAISVGNSVLGGAWWVLRGVTCDHAS